MVLPSPDASSGDADSRNSLPLEPNRNDFDTLDHGTNTPHDGPDPSSPQFTRHQVQLGSQLGKYRLIGILGQGGMGVVYRAHDTVIERDVAIKILPSELSRNTRSLQRFLGEAKAAGRLVHPNSVRIYDVDQQNDVHFIVMELVEGGNIGDIFKQYGALSVTDATRVLVDACRGIAAAHAVGLIHRDIKPSNLLIDDEATVKVADFGVAKRDDSQTMQLTGDGNLIGTPYFMSPEQCSSEPADARSDIYSLGATYYALLTGQYPYYNAQTSMQVMYSHCHADPPNPRSVSPALPHACALIVARAMAKSPSDRYQTTGEMLADLENLRTALLGPDAQQFYQPIGATSAAVSLDDPAAQTRCVASSTQANTATTIRKSRGGCLYVPLGMLLVAAGLVWGLSRHSSLDVSELFPGFATTYDQTRQLNVVCSPDKEAWFNLAAEKFQKTPEGKKIRIELSPCEWAEAIWLIADGDQHVWCPTSDWFHVVLENKRHKNQKQDATAQPIELLGELARSPMVFVMWKDRYDKFVSRYGELTWDTIFQAMTEPKGWAAIASRERWGDFKFGHADGLKCDSGAIVLCLAAYDHHNKESGLTVEDVSDTEFQFWLKTLEENLSPRDKPLPSSEEALIQTMLQDGPATYDCFVVSESLMTNHLRAADRQWGALQVIYPSRNMWNANPYYELPPTQRRSFGTIY